MIGAEVGGVPAEVSAEVREFFRANELWLTRVLSGPEPILPPQGEGEAIRLSS
jgi:hypothetical protein